MAKTDISFGVVPFFVEKNTIEVLLVHQISYRGDSFWILPKGHANPEESEEVAARRELHEETGVSKVEVYEHTPIDIHYSFVHEGEKISKTVRYFIGICQSKQTKLTQPQEIKEIKWCTENEALTLLTHENSKKVLTSALKILKENA